MSTENSGVQYEVLKEGEVVFSSSDMDTAVRKYNELLPQALQSGEWRELRKIFNGNEVGKTTKSSRTLLECNKKELENQVQPKKISTLKSRSKANKLNIGEILGGLDYRDVELILALRLYAREQGHCDVPVDDSDHSYIKGLGCFVERLKKGYSKDSNHLLVSKVMQVVPESCRIFQGAFKRE